MPIMAPISAGELVDKILILQIKSSRIGAEQRANVETERALLVAILATAIASDAKLEGLTAELLDINTRLWNIEDAIRDCERDGDFGPEFIRLARAVYRENDRRALVKRQINDVLESEIVEEKSYRPY